jgi:hypothetical protein
MVPPLLPNYHLMMSLDRENTPLQVYVEHIRQFANELVNLIHPLTTSSVVLVLLQALNVRTHYWRCIPPQETQRNQSGHGVPHVSTVVAPLLKDQSGKQGK